MADSPVFETRTPEQLPLTTAVSPDALTVVQEPGGPVQALALKRLLGKLISTDAAFETETARDAHLDFAPNSICLVYADPNPAKCGWSRKIGAPGAGSWSQFEKLGAQAAAEAAGYVALAAAAKDATIAAAATVGFETGSLQSKGGFGGVVQGGKQLRATTYFDAMAKASISNEFLSLPQMLMRETVHMAGHSAVAASGAFAGATVNPRSGLNGGPARSLEYLLRRVKKSWRVIARGTAAQTGPNVAQRTGGLPTLITLDGGATTLAAAGAVGCTCAPDSGPSMRRGQAIESYYGKVNGYPCILKCTGGPNANSPVYTIEQLNGTAVIPLTPGTAFLRNADLLDYAVNIFWMTQNDTNVQVSIDAVRAAVGKLPKPARYIVIGDWPFSLSVDGVSGNGSWDIGTPEHTRMLQKNAALREEWKSDFLDPYSFFRNEYPYDGNMYRSLAQFTGEADTLPSYDYLAPGDWRGRGLIPRRWIGVHEGGVDYSHFNSQAYQQLMCGAVDFHFLPKGWLVP